MALIVPGSGNDGRVADYGSGLFGHGAAYAAETQRPIAAIAFAGSVQGGPSDDCQGRTWMGDLGDTTSGSGSKPFQFQFFASAFQAQLYYQQSASSKFTTALATMAAATYARILATTHPAGLARAMTGDQSQLHSPGVNFLA
ncbi:MAG: hypothetical protein VYE18_08950 [Pseudomonadota bacterium]|nr:hypothetical protein [Pseudomonadota bacterium]